VQLWIALHSRFGFEEADVSAALDFVQRWPDEPAVGESVFTAFLDLAGQLRPDGAEILPELSAETLGRFQADLGLFTRSNHGYPALALQASTQAAAYDTTESARLYSIASLTALTLSDTDRAEGLLAKAQPL
jgi:hypothetical protein